MLKKTIVAFSRVHPEMLRPYQGQYNVIILQPRRASPRQARIAYIELDIETPRDPPCYSAWAGCGPQVLKVNSTLIHGHKRQCTLAAN